MSAHAHIISLTRLYTPMADRVREYFRQKVEQPVPVNIQWRNDMNATEVAHGILAQLQRIKNQEWTTAYARLKHIARSTSALTALYDIRDLDAHLLLSVTARFPPFLPFLKQLAAGTAPVDPPLGMPLPFGEVLDNANLMVDFHTALTAHYLAIVLQMSLDVPSSSMRTSTYASNFLFPALDRAQQCMDLISSRPDWEDYGKRKVIMEFSANLKAFVESILRFLALYGLAPKLFVALGGNPGSIKARDLPMRAWTDFTPEEYARSVSPLTPLPWDDPRNEQEKSIPRTDDDTDDEMVIDARMVAISPLATSDRTVYRALQKKQ